MRIKHFGVKSIQLFGSFVKDNTVNNDSDIDLLVDFDPEKKHLIITWIYPFFWSIYWVGKWKSSRTSLLANI